MTTMKTAADKLSARMKLYEHQTCNAVLDLAQHAVIRLDGHAFKTYTKHSRKNPNDHRVSNAMILTTTDLLEHFPGAVTAHTHSDEISLFFPPSTHEQPALPFGGRVQKLCSISASVASVSFNKYMSKQKFDPMDTNDVALEEKVRRFDAHFDSRVISFPSKEEVLNYLNWRSLHDCRRSSILTLAQSFYSHERLQGVDLNEICRMLREGHNVDWEELPLSYRFGVYVKKEEYEKPGYDPILQKQVSAHRTRFSARALELQMDDADFVFENVWPKPCSSALEEVRLHESETGK